MNNKRAGLFLSGLFYRSLIFKVMAIMSLITFPVFQGPWVFLNAQSSPQMIEKEEMSRLLDYWEFYDASLRSEIVDLNATVDGFGEDPKAALDWVQQNTRWVPYVGHLKNPNATYEARQGNLLDRAVLLAAMLKSMGYEVELGHSKLSAKEITMLGDSYEMPLWEKESTDSAGDEQPFTDEQIKTFAEILGVSKEEAIATWIESTHQNQLIREHILATVEKQKSLIRAKVDPEALKPVRDVETDYFWVKYKSGNDWVNVCPVFGMSIPVELTESPVGFYSTSEEIPSLLKHELEIQIKIRQWDGTKTLEKVALKRSYALSMVGNRQITISFNGQHNNQVEQILTGDNQSTEERAQAIQDLFVNETIWTPTIEVEGASAEYDYRFDVDGNLSTPGEEGMLGQGAAIKKAAGMLGGLMGNDENSTPKGVLTGIELEYKLLIPGQKAETINRTVFTLDAEAEADLEAGNALPEALKRERALACTRTTSVICQSGKIGKDLFFTKQLEFINSLRLPFKYILGKQDDGVDAVFGSASKVFKKVSPLDIPLLSLALLRSQMPSVSADVYLSTANLLSKTRQYDIGEDGITAVESIDILRNRIASVKTEPDEAFAVALEMGVFDTVAEKYVLESVTQTKSMTGGSTAMANHPDEADWTVYTENNLGELQSRCEEGAYAAIQRDVEQYGTVLALNQGSVDSWIRIDNATGEVLGAGYSKVGYGGSESAEYVALLLQISTGMSTFLGCYNGGGWTGSGNGLGCLVCAEIAGAAAFVGALYNTGAAAVGATVGSQIGGWCAAGMTMAG